MTIARVTAASVLRVTVNRTVDAVRSRNFQVRCLLQWHVARYRVASTKCEIAAPRILDEPLAPDGTRPTPFSEKGAMSIDDLMARPAIGGP